MSYSNPSYQASCQLNIKLRLFHWWGEGGGTFRTLLLVADLVDGVEQPRLPRRRSRLLVRHLQRRTHRRLRWFTDRKHQEQHWWWVWYHCTVVCFLRLIGEPAWLLILRRSRVLMSHMLFTENSTSRTSGKALERGKEIVLGDRMGDCIAFGVQYSLSCLIFNHVIS